MSEPRRLSDLLAEVQRDLDRGRGRGVAQPARRHELRGRWLRGRVRFWLALERHSERRLRRSYDRLAEHDSRN